jgi:hypothetical protein
MAAKRSSMAARPSVGPLLGGGKKDSKTATTWAKKVYKILFGWLETKVKVGDEKLSGGERYGGAVSQTPGGA